MSIGNHGTEVFLGFEGGDGVQRLFSAFDDVTPTAVWESNPVYYSIGNTVASAETVGTHVTFDYRQASFSGPRLAVVAAYSGSSSVPRWTYSFPVSIPTSLVPSGGVEISRDGQTIVAWVYQQNPRSTIVAVFNAASGTPLKVVSPATQVEPRVGKLSADGSTFLLVTGDRTWILDVQSTSTLHYSLNWRDFGNGHAISGDGSVFATGCADQQVDVYRRQGAGYSYLFSPKPGLPWRCSHAAVSDSGRILICAWVNLANLTDVRVQVYNLALAGQPLMLDEVVGGSNTFSSVATDLALSASGGTFALGVSGDGAGPLPELMVFTLNAQANAWSNAFAYSLPGSVWDLDISADGGSLAVASSSGHSSLGGGGGQIDLFALDSRDLSLDGVPHTGSTVVVRQYLTPGASGRLYMAPALAARPTVFAGMGTLYLQRSTTSTTPVGYAGSNGVLTTPIQLTSSVGSIGTTRYFQGLGLNPSRLSESWIPMTILP